MRFSICVLVRTNNAPIFINLPSWSACIEVECHRDGYVPVEGAKQELDCHLAIRDNWFSHSISNDTRARLGYLVTSNGLAAFVLGEPCVALPRNGNITAVVPPCPSPTRIILVIMPSNAVSWFWIAKGIAVVNSMTCPARTILHDDGE
jgi:hypothetical protein